MLHFTLLLAHKFIKETVFIYWGSTFALPHLLIKANPNNFLSILVIFVIVIRTKALVKTINVSLHHGPDLFQKVDHKTAIWFSHVPGGWGNNRLWKPALKTFQKGFKFMVELLAQCWGGSTPAAPGHVVLPALYCGHFSESLSVIPLLMSQHPQWPTVYNGHQHLRLLVGNKCSS